LGKNSTNKFDKKCVIPINPKLLKSVKIYFSSPFLQFWEVITHTAIPYREVQGLQGNPCNENRIPAMRTGFPVMKTGFSQ
jgi:hypothetical protein